MADDGDGWRFELEDLSDPEEDDGTVPGESTEPMEIPVEPESWSLESAAFVVLGVAVTLFVFLRFVVG